MQKVLTAAEMREVDRLTTERYGIPSIILMENAAHAVARVITEKLGGSVKGKNILILCGKGNNGGDGAALARLLGEQGAFVDVILFGKINETKGDARTNYEIYCRGRSEFEPDDWSSTEYGDLREINCRKDWDSYFSTSDQNWNVVVDALFGTGLTRPIEGWVSEVLHDINFLNDTQISFFNYDRIRVAVDIPSGLNADSGDLIGENFWADITVTFTAPKLANILPPASRFSKKLLVADIGSPKELIEGQQSNTYVSELEDGIFWLHESRFSDDSYKNKRGHCLLIAGSDDYSGAAVLAGNAAMRSGVGLVTLVTPESSRDSVASRIEPEVMVRGVAETDNGAVAEEAFDELTELLGKANAVAVGSGLSQNESTKRFVEKLIENRRQPVVVDADALNLLSPFKSGNATVKERARRVDGTLVDTRVSALILTPHEGEFLRLLGTDDKEVLNDRVAVVREFAQKHNVILVLKGERVLIGEPGGKVVVNPTGNSGLGKAGNGDTLTGILAGFVTQAAALDIDIFETVVAAVYIAGMAGDIAESKHGKRVMTASDVRECLADAFEELNVSNS
ncbi:MAG: NAD(P)H-hydrate dehydratase [Acidobacteria bacterium]|nr:NAD(P)H-hydrate dehydratase [Acidobacteriota bacterium]